MEHRFMIFLWCHDTYEGKLPCSLIKLLMAEMRVEQICAIYYIEGKVLNSACCLRWRFTERSQTTLSQQIFHPAQPLRKCCLVLAYGHDIYRTMPRLAAAGSSNQMASVADGFSESFHRATAMPPHQHSKNAGMLVMLTS